MFDTYRYALLTAFFILLAIYIFFTLLTIYWSVQDGEHVVAIFLGTVVFAIICTILFVFK